MLLILGLLPGIVANARSCGEISNSTVSGLLGDDGADVSPSGDTENGTPYNIHHKLCTKSTVNKILPYNINTLH